MTPSEGTTSTPADNELEIRGYEEWLRTRPTQRQRKRAQNRRNQQRGHKGRGDWRTAPATETQLDALRRIATATGRTFATDVTRGEAWGRIKLATTLLEDSTRRECAPPWSHLRNTSEDAD